MKQPVSVIVRQVRDIIGTCCVRHWKCLENDAPDMKASLAGTQLIICSVVANTKYVITRVHNGITISL
jgi:hypothetical protein